MRQEKDVRAIGGEELCGVAIRIFFGKYKALAIDITLDLVYASEIRVIDIRGRGEGVTDAAGSRGAG